jgi:predicted dehydrogenase
MAEKIKIGILGCASIARRLVIPNMMNTGLFNVVAVSSRTEEKAKKFSRLFSCEAILGYENLIKREEIDAVYIPLPTGMHYEWIIKSLNSGKHIFAEKSIACTYDETKDILETAKEKNLCVFENFMFPYHSQYQFIESQVNNNEIGDIKLLRSSFGFPAFDNDNNIRYKKNLGGGALLDAGAYTLKASQLLLGLEQTVIAASLENDNKEVDFHGSAMLQNKNNIISQLAFGFNNYYQNNIELWGSKGKLITHRAFTAGPGFTPTVTIENQGRTTQYSLPADNHFKKILEAFYQAIKSNNYSIQYEQILNQSNLLTQVRKFAQ